MKTSLLPTAHVQYQIWEYVCGRFSDRELHVQRKNKEVSTSVWSDENTGLYGPQQLYRLYPDKVVTPEGKLMAWVRPTLARPWGDVIPVKDK